MKAEKTSVFYETGYYLQRTSGRKLSDLLHTHTFYEFIYIVSGSCLHEINGDNTQLYAGDFVFLTPEASHRFVSQSENTDVLVLSVIPDEMNKLFSIYEIPNFSTPYSVLKLSIEKRKTLLSLCKNIVFTETKEYIKNLRMILNQMFLFCIESTSQKNDIPKYFAEILDKMQDIAFFQKV